MQKKMGKNQTADDNFWRNLWWIELLIYSEIRSLKIVKYYVHISHESNISKCLKSQQTLYQIHIFGRRWDSVFSNQFVRFEVDLLRLADIQKSFQCPITSVLVISMER